MSDAEIADKMNIKLSRLRAWRKKYPEVERAIELGRANADFAVVEAIYKKATGYTVALNKTVKLKRSDFDPETGKKIRDYEELATAIDESHVPADIRAGLFWLKSRQPLRWGDRSAISDVSGVVDIPDADSIDEESEDERQQE